MMNLKNELGDFYYIIWIIIGILVAIYIIAYNIKMQRITNKMIDLIEKSSAHCNELIKQVKECNSETEINEIILQLENENKRFQDYKNDEKHWPQQKPRILRHIKEIRTYIAFTKDYENMKKE